jgi:hypothetical protein
MCSVFLLFFFIIGVYHNIPIEREVDIYLPEPYTSCQIDNESPSASLYQSELFSLITHSEYQYSQMFCLEQCNIFLELFYFH